MNIGEKLFSPKPRNGETKEQGIDRAKRMGELCRRVLDNPDGHTLIRALYAASNPLAPRFSPGRTPEDAAFLDGERHLIGLLWANGTTLDNLNHE